MTQNKDGTQVEQQTALDHALTKLSIPDGYALKNTTAVKQDGVDMWVLRYKKSNGENNDMGGSVSEMWLHDHWVSICANSSVVNPRYIQDSNATRDARLCVDFRAEEKV